MKHFGLAAAIAGASLLALAPGAKAQTAPATPAAEPYTYTPWYERKILPDPLSATIAFWSNYRFRGVSQTSNAAGASNVVPVRPVRSEAQRDHGANKAQNGADRAARQANNSGGDGSAPAAPADGYNAGGWDGQTGGSDAAPMDDYSGAPVEAAPSDAAGSGQGTVVVALPSTGIGDEAGYGAAVGLGALAAIAAAAAVAARRVRIAG